jgi:hypothetical protein
MRSKCVGNLMHRPSHSRACNLMTICRFSDNKFARIFSENFQAFFVRMIL